MDVRDGWDFRLGGVVIGELFFAGYWEWPMSTELTIRTDGFDVPFAFLGTCFLNGNCHAVNVLALWVEIRAVSKEEDIQRKVVQAETSQLSGPEDHLACFG
jgi:hypothetical protein